MSNLKIGFKHTEKTIRKFRERKHTQETKDKISKKLKGIIRSDKTKKI